MAAAHQVSAVIFDLDGTLLDTERATRDILNEFLAAYGKVPDPEKEETRLGQMYTESTTGIIKDYGLPLTVEEYSKAMHPLYMKRWQKAKPLPGVKRLVKHLYKNGVPLAIASNSIRTNIDHKITKMEGIQGVLPIDPLLSTAQIGDRILNDLHRLVEFLDSSGRIETEPVKLLLIGYIRKLQSTDDILQALIVTNEDRSIARDVLDLPAFSGYANDLHFS
nr:unnamed protein product [Digitaria exilis]